MKSIKIFYFLFFVISSFAFTSCSSDDDSDKYDTNLTFEQQKELIVGTWYLKKAEIISANAENQESYQLLVNFIERFNTNLKQNICDYRPLSMAIVKEPKDLFDDDYLIKKDSLHYRGFTNYVQVSNSTLQMNEFDTKDLVIYVEADAKKNSETLPSHFDIKRVNIRYTYSKSK